MLSRHKKLYYQKNNIIIKQSIILSWLFLHSVSLSIIRFSLKKRKFMMVQNNKILLILLVLIELKEKEENMKIAIKAERKTHTYT